MDYELPLKNALDRAWALHLETHSEVDAADSRRYRLNDTSMENGTLVKTIRKTHMLRPDLSCSG